MRGRVIQEHDRRYPIRLICRALAVSTAGYYVWRARPESTRAVANRGLLTAIRLLHHDSRQTGVPGSGRPSAHRATGLRNIAWRGSCARLICKPRPCRNGE